MHVIVVECVGLKERHFGAEWLVEIGIKCELTQA